MSGTLYASFHLISSVIYELGTNIFVLQMRILSLGHTSGEKSHCVLNSGCKAQSQLLSALIRSGLPYQAVEYEQVCCAEIWQSKPAVLPYTK